MKNDITFEEFLDLYDWAGSYNSYMGAVYESVQHPDPTPGYNGSTKWVLDDVKNIIASSNGIPDQQDWIAILELKDNRFVFMSAGCDYTGWDCQASGRSWVSDDLMHLINLGIDQNNWERLGIEL